jgi:hypothetical protein
MASTMVRLPPTRMISSPTPVPPAAPAVLSTYRPWPISGESPTRPGSLCGRPDVVQTPPSDPFLSSASTVTVSWPSSGVPPAGRAGAGPRGLGRVFSHSATLSGVSSVSSGKPCCSAKRRAPSPTSRMCGVFSITRRARAAGWRTFSRPATAPHAIVLPSITQASSCTVPMALASPP